MRPHTGLRHICCEVVGQAAYKADRETSATKRYSTVQASEVKAQWTVRRPSSKTRQHRTAPSIVPREREKDGKVEVEVEVEAQPSRIVGWIKAPIQLI